MLLLKFRTATVTTSRTAMEHNNDTKPVPKPPAPSQGPVPDRTDLPGRASSIFRRFHRPCAQIRTPLNNLINTCTQQWRRQEFSVGG